MSNEVYTTYDLPTDNKTPSSNCNFNCGTSPMTSKSSCAFRDENVYPTAHMDGAYSHQPV
jgi:hypothetical protein